MYIIYYNIEHNCAIKNNPENNVYGSKENVQIN